MLELCQIMVLAIHVMIRDPKNIPTSSPIGLETWLVPLEVETVSSRPGALICLETCAAYRDENACPIQLAMHEKSIA